jgi:hypothetical protein
MRKTIGDILENNDATKNLLRLIYGLFGIPYITFLLIYVLLADVPPTRMALLITPILLILWGGLRRYLWRDKQ